MSTQVGFGTAVSATWIPDAVERFGRRWKMEYVGMASVFAVLFQCFFHSMVWQQALAATAATFFLFLGLKKKTRDHLLTSLLMFTVASVGHHSLASVGWTLPFLFFGVCLWALEGYMEKRQGRVYALPFVLVAWALAGSSWIAGLLFICSYLAHPWTQRPGLRRRLAALTAIGAIGAGAAYWARFDPHRVFPVERLPLAGHDFVLLLVLGLPTLACLVAFWRHLAMPHAINAVLFGLLATWDLRALSVFAIAAAVVLAATVLRNSADATGLSAFLKRAEWYYFWLVLVIAVSEAIALPV